MWKESTHAVLEEINLFNGTGSINFTADNDVYEKPPYQWSASVSPPFQITTAEEKATYHGRARIQIQMGALGFKFKLTLHTSQDCLSALMELTMFNAMQVRGCGYWIRLQRSAKGESQGNRDGVWIRNGLKMVAGI